MFVLLLLSGLIGGASDWVLAPEEPDQFEVGLVMAEDPVALLLFIARTGWVPDGVHPDSLAMEIIRTDPSSARTAAWAARTAGYPLRTDMTPIPLEFGDVTLIPSLEEAVRSPLLIDAALRRMLHAYAEGGEPDSIPEMVALIASSWGFMSFESRGLALEALGKAGVDISGDISLDELLQAGLRASARYFSEIDVDHSYPIAGECLPLDRVYIASCAPDDETEFFLTDPLWAVRYTAAGACTASALAPLLMDAVPYVALRAAELRSAAGFQDGRQVIREMALTPGPVGHQAAALLGIEDSLLLTDLMGHPEPARRAAAQSAWLADSIDVRLEVARKWLTDPYWIIPVSWVWHLTETGDSLAAEEGIIVLLADQENYSDPEAVVFYADMLRSDLRNEEDDIQSPELPMEWTSFELPFDPKEISADTAVIMTDEGPIEIELWNETAPVTAAAFAYLAGTGFYDGIAFHRVIPGFVAQAGCPEGAGTGGPGFELPAEPSLRSFQRGVVGMADSGLNTGGSQFFIMLDSHGRLDGRYTAFGRVTDASQLDCITVGTVIRSVTLR